MSKEHFFKVSSIKLNQFFTPKIKMSLKHKRDSIVALSKDSLTAGFCRNDYCGLTILTLVYLRSTPPEYQRLQKPGKNHNARWMPKLTYSIKMVLSSHLNRISDAAFCSEQLEKLDVFVKVMVYCYVPWWLTSTHSSAAPTHDVCFIKTLMNFPKIHLDTATAALDEFTYHL